MKYTLYKEMFGPHVSRTFVDFAGTKSRPRIDQHIDVAVNNDSGFKIGAVSIFVGGPKNKVINLKEEEQVALKEYIGKTGIIVIAHSAYAASPFSPDEDIRKRSIEYIKSEQITCQNAGITGLVIHLPKRPKEDVLAVLEIIAAANAPDVTIYLETPAVKPKESYYETPDKLNELFADLPPKFGLCIDTAHLWVCGIDLSSYKSAKTWLSMLKIDPRRIMFHLNDSVRELGVGPDTHAPLCQGKIWGADQGGLVAFLEFIREHNLACILERNDPNTLVNDYKIITKN